MPTYARNDLSVSVGDTSYTPNLTFQYDQPSQKLTLIVESAAVYLQVKDAIHTGFGSSDEVKLLPGSHSRTFPTPVYGFRLRGAGTAATVSFAYYT